jgi:hypothetical protein
MQKQAERPYRTSFDEYVHGTIFRRPGITELEIVVDVGQVLGFVDYTDAEWAVVPRVADAVQHLLKKALVSEHVSAGRVSLYSVDGNPNPAIWLDDDRDLGFLRFEDGPR